MDDQGITRGRLLLGGLTSGAAAIGVIATSAPDEAVSVSSTTEDERVLRYLLELEHLQAALYAKAVEDGDLKGDLAEYAKTVDQQEREHVDLLTKLLGGNAPKAGQYDFGDATSSNAKFLTAAVDLEETGLSAYSGAAARVSPDALREVAKVLSVEARHAAWARDLAGRSPAPDASDRARTQSDVEALVRKTGYRKDTP